MDACWYPLRRYEAKVHGQNKQNELPLYSKSFSMFIWVCSRGSNSFRSPNVVLLLKYGESNAMGST